MLTPRVLVAMLTVVGLFSVALDELRLISEGQYHICLGVIMGLSVASLVITSIESYQLARWNDNFADLARWRDREINLSPSADIKAAGRKNDPENTIQKGSR